MTELVPVVPAPLDTLAVVELDAAAGLARKSRSDATWATYEADFKQFSAWCADRGLCPLPASPETLTRWLGSVCAQYKPATVRRKLASIGVVHKANGYDPAPTGNVAVRTTLEGFEREHGVAQRKARAVRTAELRALVRPLQPGRLIDVRDRAILVIGMAGAFRRSELVAIDVEHVTEDEDGLRIRVLRSKRDQRGEGALVGVAYGSNPGTCPVRSWRAWLAASGIQAGPVFRGMDRHGNLLPNRLQPRQVARIVQRRAAAVGLPAKEFSAHSLRAGFATKAYEEGQRELAIMRHGRWKSATSMRGYVQEGGLWVDNPSAALGL